MSGLPEDQVEQFHQDGFTIVRGAFDTDQVDALRAAADDMLKESRSRTASDSVFELEPDHTFNNPRLRRISHPVAHRSIFWETATSPVLLDAIAPLIGEDIKFHHSKLNMKVGGGGTEIGWHQDFAFFPHTNDDLVACGLALDPSTTENGCLLVIPGSHRWEMLEHWDGEDFVGKIVGNQLDDSASVPVELEPGDVSIHHARVVHGSATNNSTQARRILIFQYAACDAVQLDKRPPANEYSERVVRGEPSKYARFPDGTRFRLRGDVKGARSLFDRQKAVAR